MTPGVSLNVRDAQGVLIGTMQSLHGPVPRASPFPAGTLYRNAPGVTIEREGPLVVVGSPQGRLRFVCRSVAALRFFADAMVLVTQSGSTAEALAPLAHACGLLRRAVGPLATAEAEDAPVLSAADARIVGMIAAGRRRTRVRGWKETVRHEREAHRAPDIALPPRAYSPVAAPRALPDSATAFRTDGVLDMQRFGRWLTMCARWRELERGRHANALPFDVVEEGFPDPAPWGATRWTLHARAVEGVADATYRYDPVGHGLNPTPGQGAALRRTCEASLSAVGRSQGVADGVLVISVVLRRLVIGLDEPVVPLAARSAAMALAAALAAAGACGMATCLVEPVPAAAWYEAEPDAFVNTEVPLAGALFGRPVRDGGGGVAP